MLLQGRRQGREVLLCKGGSRFCLRTPSALCTHNLFSGLGCMQRATQWQPPSLAPKPAQRLEKCGAGGVTSPAHPLPSGLSNLPGRTSLSSACAWLR